jgi:hypothetical protein
MWNSIVNAAKAVYNTVVPKAPKPTPTPTSYTVATFKNPGQLQGGSTSAAYQLQPTASGESLQYGANPQQPANVTLQGSGAINQPHLSVAPTVSSAQTNAELAAQRVAQARAAAVDQQSRLAKVWQGVLTPSAKLGDIYAQYKGKQYTKKVLEQQNKNIPDMVARWRGAADGKISQARQDLATGNISVEQYNAIVDAEKGKLEKNATSYTDLFNSEQRQVDAPYPGAAAVGGAVSGFQKLGGGLFGNIWKYSLGSGGKNVPSLVTLPSRVVNTTKNILGTRPNAEGYTGLHPLTAWQNSYNQPNLTNAELQKQYEASLIRGKSGKFYDPITRKEVKPGDMPSNQNFRGQLTNAAVDPINFLPAGWLSKGGKLLTKSPKAFDSFSPFNTLKNDILPALSKSPAGRAFAKLTAPTRSTNQAWLDKVHETLNGADNKFAKLNDGEIQAYQNLMQGKKVAWAPEIDRAKVTQFASTQRGLYDAMHKAENAAGLPTKYTPGYLPTKTQQTDSKFSFLFKKTGKAASDLSAEQLRRAEAFRQWEHLNALAKVQKAGGKLPSGIENMNTIDAANALRASSGMAGRPQHQIDIEKALAAGNRDEAVKIVQKLDDSDPYKRSMASLLGLKVAAPKVSAGASAYAKFAAAAKASPKILQQAPNRRFLSTDTSTLGKIPRAAESAWKTAVLKLNPAWYVHNAMWNAPASFLAGGTKTFGGYAKMFRKGALDELPKELTGGAFGGLGGKIENMSRGAAYYASRAKGMTHADAIKNVNKYLFDYSQHANWEKPVRAALPFWSWQKNIARLATQLPNSNPIASNVFHQIDANNNRELNKIPDKGVSYTDPETGRTLSVDPRKQFEGKVKTPWGWVSAAGLPILPSQLSQFGVNPLLSSAKRFFTGKDYFGNSTNGETVASLAGSNTPHTKLVQSMADMFTKSGSQDNWISGAGYAKGAQGVDPSKPNYKASLDPTHNFFASLKSLSGVPFATNFDENRFRESLRYDQFSKEYFNHNWNKEFPASADYNAKVAAQQAVAKKYGYDLQKDIYNDKWSKYDSPATVALKARGDAARSLQDQVYAIYNKLPAKTGARSQFIAMWKSQMADPKFKEFNPDFNVFKNVPITGGVPTEKGGFANYTTSKFATPTASSAKASFWKNYYATSDKAARSAMLKANPQYAKYSSAATDPRKAKLAWAYQNLPPDVRTSWLKKEGLLDPAKDNWTTAQWKDYLISTGNDPTSKLGRDLVSYPSLGQSQLDNVNRIVSSFRPVAKVGAAVKFGRGFGRSLTKKR